MTIKNYKSAHSHALESIRSMSSSEIKARLNSYGPKSMGLGFMDPEAYCNVRLESCACGRDMNVDDPDIFHASGVYMRFQADGTHSYVDHSSKDDRDIQCFVVSCPCGLEYHADTSQEAYDGWNKLMGGELVGKTETIEFLIREIEGAYTTDDPDDNGGLTSFGLLKSEVVEKGYDWPITYDFAVYFFGKYYWRNVKLSLIESDAIRYRLFVDGVHIGSHRPIKYLQRILNASNNRARRWPDLVVDGLLGAKTASALGLALVYMSHDSIADQIRALTYGRYLRIVEANESQEKWFNGWRNRLGKFPS